MTDPKLKMNVLGTASLPRARTSSSLANTVRVSTAPQRIAGSRRTVNLGTISTRQK